MSSDAIVSESHKGSGMGGGIVPGVFAQAESMRPTLVGEHWAVVAGHSLVSQVAQDVLAAGGNAIDAGVAAGFASNVIQVDMCNLGGIAPILVHQAGHCEVQTVAGVGKWGSGASVERIRAKYGDSLPLGGAPCIVPAALSAWLVTLERFGTKSLHDVITPAIAYASNGFVLDERTASSFATMSAGFGAWQSSVDVLMPYHRKPRIGDRLVQPALADTLRMLDQAEQEALERGLSREQAIQAAHDSFYRGEPSRIIAQFVEEHGGFLTADDIASYRAEISNAPMARFHDWDFYLTDGWSQGAVIGIALKILEKVGIESCRNGSTQWVHLLVEALKLAFSERERALGDPAFCGERIVEELLDDKHIAELARRIRVDALQNLPTLAKQAGPALGSTTAIVVQDVDGNTFSCAPSDTIDGAPIIPELGIICSPRGVQSRIAEGHPNGIAPGKRPCVTPAATIAINRNDPEKIWSMACPGGDVIVQAMTQVILNMEVSHMSPQRAVEQPRVFGSSYPGGFAPHPQGDRLVYVEADHPAETIAGLKERGHRIVLWPANEFDAGSVQTIIQTKSAAGEPFLQTGADSRRSAYAVAR
jgi:gamma-glutamyltranspeptidase/glutathione hydrolase